MTMKMNNMKTVKLNWLQRLFHSHNFEYMETVISNSKGEIWITGCECGNRNKAYFNAEGKCVHVEDITPDEVSALRISYRKKDEN